MRRLAIATRWLQRGKLQVEAGQADRDAAEHSDALTLGAVPSQILRRLGEHMGAGSAQGRLVGLYS